jgi:hypothetical protein
MTRRDGEVLGVAPALSDRRAGWARALDAAARPGVSAVPVTYPGRLARCGTGAAVACETPDFRRAHAGLRYLPRRRRGGSAPSPTTGSSPLRPPRPARRPPDSPGGSRVHVRARTGHLCGGVRGVGRPERGVCDRQGCPGPEDPRAPRGTRPDPGHTNAGASGPAPSTCDGADAPAEHYGALAAAHWLRRTVTVLPGRGSTWDAAALRARATVVDPHDGRPWWHASVRPAPRKPRPAPAPAGRLRPTRA